MADFDPHTPVAHTWFAVSLLHCGKQTPMARRYSMTGAQQMKRVFGICIETCWACGGALQIIARIEDPAVIKKILTHLDSKDASGEPSRLPNGIRLKNAAIRLRSYLNLLKSPHVTKHFL
jgi:hypothetical protein